MTNPITRILEIQTLLNDFRIKSLKAELEMLPENELKELLTDMENALAYTTAENDFIGGEELILKYLDQNV